MIKNRNAYNETIVKMYDVMWCCAYMLRDTQNIPYQALRCVHLCLREYHSSPSAEYYSRPRTEQLSQKGHPPLHRYSSVAPRQSEVWQTPWRCVLKFHVHGLPLEALKYVNLSDLL